MTQWTMTNATWERLWLGAFASTFLTASIASAGADVAVCQVVPEQIVFTFHDLPNSAWGTAVAIRNDTIAAGGQGNGVRIFQHDANSGWVITQELSPPDATHGFGSVLSMSDDLLLIGAPSDGTQGENAGAAYIYQLRDGHWSFEVKLLAPDGAAGAQFGQSMAIAGVVVVIGAPNAGPNSRGAAYVYRFNGRMWAFEQRPQPDVSNFARLGRAVSASEGEILIGTAANIGKVFVYRFDGSSWVQSQLIQQAGIGPGIAVDGDWAVLAQPGSNPTTGSAAIYRRQGNNWVSHSQITAGPPGSGFGNSTSVAIDGDWIIVGSPDYYNGLYLNTGIVRAYHLDSNAWLRAMDMAGTPEIYAYQGATQLGASVSIHHGRVVAGTPAFVVPTLTSGSIWVYPMIQECGAKNVFRPCDMNDCNHNQIPDSCEIARRPSSDCNKNGAVDECETTMVYSVDDGSTEQSWGTYVNYPGFDSIWLNQFEVRPGLEVIDHLAIMETTGALGGWPVTLLVYRDQNNDGDPHDALLLCAVNRWTNSIDNHWPAASRFSYQSITPLYLGPPGQKFFVGARITVPRFTFPIAVDSNSPPQHRGWFIVNQFGQSDIQNLSNNPEFTAPGASPITAGNYAIRALVTDCNLNGVWDGCDIANGTSQDLNANGIPDECEHCRADLAPPGGNGFVDLDDLLGVLDAWGMIGNTPADITADQKVDVDDLLAVLAAWGPCPHG